MLECFFVYPVRGIEQGSAPQRTKNSPVDCFLARGRFPHGSPKNTPAYAGVFFRVSRARNRTGRCAAAHKKQSSGLFFSPREIPACVTRNTPAYAGVFFRVSRARNRTGQCAAAHKKQSSGLFFSPREIPACVTKKHSSLYWSVFSCIPCEESNRAVRRSAQKTVQWTVF